MAPLGRRGAASARALAARVRAAQDWDTLLARAVAPKLEHALLAELVVDRDAGADAAALAGVAKGGAAQVGAALGAKYAREEDGRAARLLLPKWHRVLHTWLAARPETEARDPVSPSPPDLERVTRWYLGWKSLFSEDLLAHERVRAQINVALDMMSRRPPRAAASRRRRTPPTRRGARRRLRAARRARRRGRGRGWGWGRGIRESPFSRESPAVREMDDDELRASMSLREVVEAFAVSRDVRFAPKPGREAPSGLRVWSFGAVSVTIDAAKQIVRAHVDGRWAPVSLDQLLEMHEKKERAKSKTF